MIYDFESIDEQTREILQLLDDLGLPPELAVQSLCRTIAVIGEPYLDTACRWIDDMTEEPFITTNPFREGHEEYNQTDR